MKLRPPLRLRYVNPHVYPYAASPASVFASLFASGGFNSSIATAAPRIVAAHPGAGEALNEQHGLRNARANKRNYTTIMGEWKTLYGEVPPESSLLLRKYRQMYHVPATTSK